MSIVRDPMHSRLERMSLDWSAQHTCLITHSILSIRINQGLLLSTKDCDGGCHRGECRSESESGRTGGDGTDYETGDAVHKSVTWAVVQTR